MATVKEWHSPGPRAPRRRPSDATAELEADDGRAREPDPRAGHRGYLVSRAVNREVASEAAHHGETLRGPDGGPRQGRGSHFGTGQAAAGSEIQSLSVCGVRV